MLYTDYATLTLSSPNLARLRQFYRTLLDIAPSFEFPNTYVEFQIGLFRFGIFQPKQEHAGEFAASHSGAMSLCLEVDNLEQAIAAVEAAHSAIAAAPPRPASPIITDFHGREAYAYDPDGNRLILHESRHPATF
ncbi:VOC family protein [Thermoleptolyngbya sp. C42_A2020_037]|uniref:VOC family protein n=1 Tax=Thermoleptolyngbya sp. C42_A2020_037 TaxID=2747799 RepID=UPI0025E71B7D|nr:VOC family protein [Thermoleptolyngbya sp. C42_A2020_037]